MTSEQEFTQIQNSLKNELVLHNQFDKANIRTIAGVDLAYWKQDDREYAVCRRELRLSIYPKRKPHLGYAG